MVMPQFSVANGATGNAWTKRFDCDRHQLPRRGSRIDTIGHGAEGTEAAFSADHSLNWDEVRMLMYVKPVMAKPAPSMAQRNSRGGCSGRIAFGTSVTHWMTTITSNISMIIGARADTLRRAWMN